jgi:hypothetical protein
MPKRREEEAGLSPKPVLHSMPEVVAAIRTIIRGMPPLLASRPMSEVDAIRLLLERYELGDAVHKALLLPALIQALELGIEDGQLPAEDYEELLPAFKAKARELFGAEAARFLPEMLERAREFLVG